MLDQELDAQLVGLARLVVEPGRRRSLANQPVITVASDLHNNAVGLGVLERLSNGGPVFFVGDLTDRGIAARDEPGPPRRAQRQAVRVRLRQPRLRLPLRARSRARARSSSPATAGCARTGRPTTALVHTIRPGLRVAGYDDPYERRSAESFKDRYNDAPDPAEQDKFTGWLMPLIGKVDVVMVHEPALIAPALQILKDKPPEQPLVFLVGHTHTAALSNQPGVTVINGGSIGAGGTGNLTEPTSLGIARFVFTLEPSFQPLAADLVSIDPGTGSSSRPPRTARPRGSNRVTPTLWDELLELDRGRVWHPYGPMPAVVPPLPVVSAQGVRLKLADGRELIDGMASWWCAIHGYRHPVHRRGGAGRSSTAWRT